MHSLRHDSMASYLRGCLDSSLFAHGSLRIATIRVQFCTFIGDCSRSPLRAQTVSPPVHMSASLEVGEHRLSSGCQFQDVMSAGAGLCANGAARAFAGSAERWRPAPMRWPTHGCRMEDLIAPIADPGEGPGRSTCRGSMRAIGSLRFFR